jgi:hypothetical protein
LQRDLVLPLIFPASFFFLEVKDPVFGFRIWLRSVRSWCLQSSIPLEFLSPGFVSHCLLVKPKKQQFFLCCFCLILRIARLCLGFASQCFCLTVVGQWFPLLHTEIASPAQPFSCSRAQIARGQVRLFHSCSADFSFTERHTASAPALQTAHLIRAPWRQAMLPWSSLLLHQNPSR